MKRPLVLLGALALVLSTASVAGAEPPIEQHCPDHQSETKVETSQTVTVQDQDGDDVEVEVEIDGSEVTFTGDDVEAVEYCLKAGTDNTGIQSGLDGDTDHIPNRGGLTGDISYVVLYVADTTPPVTTTRCGEPLSASGGIEGFEGAYDLGTTSVSFLFFYEAGNAPARFELIYGGTKLLDVVSGLGADDLAFESVVDAWVADGATIDPAAANAVFLPWGGTSGGTSSEITVRVTGSDSSTNWTLYLECPAA